MVRGYTAWWFAEEQFVTHIRPSRRSEFGMENLGLAAEQGVPHNGAAAENFATGLEKFSSYGATVKGFYVH